MTILVVWRQAGGWVYYNISQDRCILYSPERKIDTFMIIWSSYLRYYYRIVQSRDCIPAVVSRPFGIGARRQERQSARWTSWLFLRMALYSLVAKRARALICFAAHVACCMLRLGDLCSFRGSGQMCARAHSSQWWMRHAECVLSTPLPCSARVVDMTRWHKRKREVERATATTTTHKKTPLCWRSH